MVRIRDLFSGTKRRDAVRCANAPFAKMGSILLACAAGLIMMPAEAQAPDLALLDGLQKGEWELRFRDGTPARRICMRTGRELIQLKHAGKRCGRYSIEPGDDEVTVQYACKGDGFGRTNVRKETATLVQLESHGIAGDLPFHFTGEGRRIGNCT